MQNDVSACDWVLLLLGTIGMAYFSVSLKFLVPH
jgi:hypothetical protein